MSDHIGVPDGESYVGDLMAWQEAIASALSLFDAGKPAQAAAQLGYIKREMWTRAAECRDEWDAAEQNREALEDEALGRPRGT